jgi:hypothetical protein
MSQNVGSNVYDGMATIGQTGAFIRMLSLCVIGILILICSIYIFTHPSNYINGIATAGDSFCNPTGNTNICTTKILYTVNGKNYNGTITSNIPYEKGIQVNISYDPNNPTNVTAQQLQSWIMAFICLIIGLCLMSGGYLNYYLTSTSKAYAAMEGVVTLRHL